MIAPSLPILDQARLQFEETGLTSEKDYFYLGIKWSRQHEVILRSVIFNCIDVNRMVLYASTSVALKEMKMNYQQAMYSATQPVRLDAPWDTFSDSLHESLDRLEEILDDVSYLSAVCRDEWCEAADCMLGEVTVAAFAVSEPHWTPEDESKRLKGIKRRIHDLHADRTPTRH